jgi:hypothetical protein
MKATAVLSFSGSPLVSQMLCALMVGILAIISRSGSGVTPSPSAP